MSAAEVKEREEAALQIFDDACASTSSASAAVRVISKSTDLAWRLKWLEKLQRMELSKWWESKSLQRYLEVQRVPRGLQIMVAPSYEEPNPDMLSEWAANNNDASRRMLAILIKYSDIDRQKILAEIESLSDTLSKAEDQDSIKQFKIEMKERLRKLEVSIQERKAQTFIRDKQDYDRGHIYTFAKKFDTIRRQKMVKSSRPVQEIHSEQSSIQSSEIDTDLEEDQNIQGPVPSVIDEFDFLREEWWFNLRPRPPIRTQKTRRGRGREARCGKVQPVEGMQEKKNGSKK